MFGYIASFIAILGVYFNAKKNKLCWYCWMISNMMWLIISLIRKDYAQVILWIVFFGMNFYGLYKWRSEP